MASSSSSFNDNLGADPYYLHIGPEKKVFLVHKKLLISQSKYFADQLATTPGDALHLEEEYPAAFALLVEFLYRGTVAGYLQKQLECLATKAEPFPKAEETDYSTLLPPFQDGTRISFTVYIEKEPNTPTNQYNAFQTICSTQMYQRFSLEELRLSDYIAGRKFNWAAADRFNKHAISTLNTNMKNTSITQLSVLPALSPTTSGGLFGGTAASPSGSPSGNLGYTTASSGMPLPRAFLPSSGDIPGTSAPSAGTTVDTLFPPTSNSAFGSPAGLSTSTNPLFGGATGTFANSSNTPNNPSSSSSLVGGLNSTSIVTSTQGASVTSTHASLPASGNLFPSLNRTINDTSSTSDLFPSLGNAPSAVTGTPSSQTRAGTVISGSNLTQVAPMNTNLTASTITPQPSSVLVKGPPQDAHSSHSLALLHLLLLAEKASWANLFNRAIKPYVSSLSTLSPFQGLSHNIPKSHVELIYSRTKPGSTLRMVAVDCICLNSAETKEFMDFTQDNREFLADVWGKAMGRQGDRAKEVKPILDGAKEGIYDFSLDQIKRDQA